MVCVALLCVLGEEGGVFAVSAKRLVIVLLFALLEGVMGGVEGGAGTIDVHHLTT